MYYYVVCSRMWECSVDLTTIFVSFNTHNEYKRCKRTKLKIYCNSPFIAYPGAGWFADIFYRQGYTLNHNRHTWILGKIARVKVKCLMDPSLLQQKAKSTLFEAIQISISPHRPIWLILVDGERWKSNIKSLSNVFGAPKHGPLPPDPNAKFMRKAFPFRMFGRTISIYLG